MRRYYLGIDPGMQGGLACIYVDKEVKVFSCPMPVTERDIYQWFEEFISRYPNVKAMVEKVSGYIGENQPGSRAFKFGHNYGNVRMAMVACKIPFDEVTPQKWQKELGVNPRDKSKNETDSTFKARLKQKAQQLFPNDEITLSTADAILIAEYLRRIAPFS